MLQNFTQQYWLICTGRLIMFSMITNICNKKAQRTYLNWIVHSHRITDFFWQLEMFDVCTDVAACVARTWIPYRPCCTHRKSLVVKKNSFKFSCDCEQFHQGRSFGFLVLKVCNHGVHYETPCISFKKARVEKDFVTTATYLFVKATMVYFMSITPICKHLLYSMW
jgi:hypothetical protein